MKAIHTDKAPKAAGPYSQAILANNTIFCSGQIGINPSEGNLVEGFENQCEQVMKNISEVLEEAGFSFDNVVKTTCFLSDMETFSKFNQIYEKYFVSKPARSCVEAKLPKGAMVEVEVIAVK